MGAERGVRLGPSILSADFLRLGQQIAEAEAAGADFFHVDVMDGRFVPNISVGLPVLEAARRATALPLDVHFMVVDPARWVAPFAEAGADAITVHVEADPHLYATIRLIEQAGVAPGVTLNPATPLAMVDEVLPLVRQVLVMSVSPGFGGQTFIPAALDRIRRLRERIDEVNPECALAVDGGIKAGNIARVAAAGADTLIVGSAVYTPERSVADAMADLRAALGGDAGGADPSQG